MARRGQPTKYKKEYCELIVKFFSKKPFRNVKVLTTDVRSGREYVNYERLPAELPTMESFAHKLGVNTDTLVEWRKVHPEFSVATTHAKDIQKHILVTNGLMGLYNPSFAQFVAKNFTDMKDKQERELSGPDGRPIQVIDMSRDANND